MADPLVNSVAQIEATTTPNVSPEPAKGNDVKASILSWLGADPEDKQAAYIMEQVKGDTIIDALSELKDIERRIGPPKYGENRLQRLHDYLKVLAQFKESKQELERLER